jgi:hypothetical protein
VTVSVETAPGGYTPVNSGSAVTDAAGNYTVGGLAPGVRWVEFAAPEPYTHEFWPDVTSDMQAAQVVTSAGQHVTGINAALQVAASLSGTITSAATGAAIHDVDVTVFDAHGEVARTHTDVAGHYAATGLNAGSYTLWFTYLDLWGTTTPYVSQYWPSAYHPADATPVSIAGGENRTGIDATMSQPATVNGVITRSDNAAPVVGAQVAAIDSEGWEVSSGTTGADGKYSIESLPAGTFTITEHPAAVSGDANDLVVASSTVTVAAASTATVDFTPVMGGHLTGILRYPTGTKAPVRVTAYRHVDGQWVAEATSATYGAVQFLAGDQFIAAAYDLGALEPGQYIVKFEQPGMCTKYWDGGFSPETATTIPLSAHHGAAGISAYMTASCTNPAVVPGTVSISGTPAVGSSVTATAKSWQPAALGLAYQWYAVSGATSTPITGATSATFRPTSAQVGKSLKAVVTGSLPASASFTRTSATVGKVALTSTPTISGVRASGDTLTARPGTWTKGTKLSYAWYGNGYYIPGTSGPTHSTLKLTSLQENEQISVKVTGTLAGYPTVARTSAWTSYITWTAAPTISGTRKVGSTLTAHPGSWSPGTRFTYRWYANGVAISGATHATLKLTSAQRGKMIKVVAIGSNPGYQTVSRTSGSTARIS